MLPTKSWCQRSSHLKLLLNYHTMSEEAGTKRGPGLVIRGRELAILTALLEGNPSPTLPLTCSSQQASASSKTEVSTKCMGTPVADSIGMSVAEDDRDRAITEEEDRMPEDESVYESLADDHEVSDAAYGDGWAPGGTLRGWDQILCAVGRAMPLEECLSYREQLSVLQEVASSTGYESAAWARRQLHSLLLAGDGRSVSLFLIL